VSVVIADDEPVARAGLRDMLSDVAWITVSGEASNGLAAVEVIDRIRPDLVFLDIQMPGLIGTDVLTRVKHQPYVVFTTAYAQHAATAFELGAVDYLLKPFGPERLAKSLERIRAALGEPGSPPAFDRLREALGTGPMSRLFVRTGNAVVPVLVANVSWFEASGDYVTAVTGTGRHLMHVSLNRLESRLDPARFVRIHRAHIVNLDHVSAFRRSGRGLVAEMKNGVRLPVSRERAKDVRSLGV
jgi:two-component system LytT family response regulator